MDLVVSTYSELNLRILTNALQRVGHQNVTPYDTGQEMLAHAQDTAPDLIIFEKKLSDMEGLVLVEQLKAISGAQRSSLLMLGDEFTKREVVCALQKGVDDVLIMPYRLEKLYEKVTHFLEARYVLSHN